MNIRPMIKQNRMLITGSHLFVLLGGIIALHCGCTAQENPSLVMRSTVEKADNESVPISVVQPPSNEIVMDLIDIGEYPELEPSLEFPNTPLYISDDEDFDTAQGFTDLDKIGVKKFIVDAFPLLYQPLGTLKDTAYSSDRITFISASGYFIRCQPVHWDLMAFGVQDRPADYLVDVYVFVSEYCDEDPTDGCREQWSFPKNALTSPVLVSRSVFPK